MRRHVCVIVLAALLVYAFLTVHSNVALFVAVVVFRWFATIKTWRLTRNATV
jgi:hypothetical protein